MLDRIIFHADCNNFFASCECLQRPELKNVPMAVAGDPENRVGVVVAKNEIAKRYGVKTTDTVYQAKKKCPDIVFVPPRRPSQILCKPPKQCRIETLQWRFYNGTEKRQKPGRVGT